MPTSWSGCGRSRWPSAGICRHRWPLPRTDVRRVGLAGVGLIGASIGLRAAELGWPVTGWDANAEHLALARERGAIGAVAASLLDLARASDVLVLAMPLASTLACLAALVADPPACALVLDVASVKAPVAAAGASLATFVGTHPIAGSERSGPAAARADLFDRRAWTYDAHAAEPARSAAAAFVRALGARAYGIGNAEHDRLLALTSHLPQIVSVALGKQLDERTSDSILLQLCGTGMRSMLRLGASAWTVWGAVLAANAGPLAQEVRRLADILNGIAEALESGRAGALKSDFEAAARAVARLDENDRAAASLDRANALDER